MDIKINNNYGDILGDYATKNIMNYYKDNNPEVVIEAVTKLIKEIKNSEIENKNILVENIQQKTKKPMELKKYLESLTNISSIASNISDVLQYLKF